MFTRQFYHSGEMVMNRMSLEKSHPVVKPKCIMCYLKVIRQIKIYASECAVGVSDLCIKQRLHLTCPSLGQ